MFLKPEYNLTDKLFMQTTVVIRLEWTILFAPVANDDWEDLIGLMG